MDGVLEEIQKQSGGARSAFEFGRFVDKSINDELEREGFLRGLAKNNIPPKLASKAPASLQDGHRDHDSGMC